jgi:rod shape-determining protein MreD
MSLQLGIPLFLVGAVLQAALVPRLRIFGGQPDLIVVIVLVWAYLDRTQEGLVWGFVGGFFIDLLSGVPPGISTLALVPVAFLVSTVEFGLYRGTILVPLGLAAGGALGYHLLTMILLRFLVNYPIDFGHALINITLPSVIFDMIIFIPLLSLLERGYDRLHPRAVKI